MLLTQKKYFVLHAPLEDLPEDDVQYVTDLGLIRRKSQLLLQAFLQRIINSGGRIEREYGLGRQRVDLLVLWPLKPAQDEKPDWTRWQGPVKKGKLQVSYLLAFLSSINYTIKDVRTQTNSYIPKMAAQVKRLPG